MRHHLDEGVRLPLDRGAAAHILRAYGGARDSISERVRRNGYYVSVGERNPDLSAVAVALLGRDGALRGALALSGPSSRFTAPAHKTAVTLLTEAAERLSKLLL